MTRETLSMQFESEVIAELRALALDGAKVATLVHLIRSRLALAPNAVLIVLRYLGKAFDVQLNTILPLRELIDFDDDTQHYLQAMRICFWFSAEMRAACKCNAEWNWDEFRRQFPRFQANLLENCSSDPDHLILGCFSGSCPDTVYLRGEWAISKFKHPALDPSDKAILAAIRRYGRQWENCIRMMGRTDESTCRMGISFDIKEGGPSYLVRAFVEVQLDKTSRTESPVQQIATMASETIP